MSDGLDRSLERQSVPARARHAVAQHIRQGVFGQALETADLWEMKARAARARHRCSLGGLNTWSSVANPTCGTLRLGQILPMNGRQMASGPLQLAHRTFALAAGRHVRLLSETDRGNANEREVTAAAESGATPHRASGDRCPSNPPKLGNAVVPARGPSDVTLASERQSLPPPSRGRRALNLGGLGVQELQKCLALRCRRPTGAG